jgi:hypothetical protein
MPDWKTRHSTKLFAERVMPKLRDLWPEWSHDERWWIKPMEDRLRPSALPPVGTGTAIGTWPADAPRP